MAGSDALEDVASLTARAGRRCLILSLDGCPPCAKLKAAILDRVSDEELARIFEVKLEPYENRDHRAFIRANGVTGFPTVQLYEDGDRLWNGAWVFDEDVLAELLAWLREPGRPLALPEPPAPSKPRSSAGRAASTTH